MKPVILHQDSRSTTIKCPECKSGIVCHHGNAGCANDGFGRLDLGQQNHLAVVCMSQRGVGGTYCQFAKNVWFKEPC